MTKLNQDLIDLVTKPLATVYDDIQGDPSLPTSNYYLILYIYQNGLMEGMFGSHGDEAQAAIQAAIAESHISKVINFLTSRITLIG